MGKVLVFLFFAIFLVFSQASTIQIFFQLFDQNADYYVSPEELAETIWRLESNDDSSVNLNNIPYALRVVVRDDFMKKADLDQDNLISYDEWEKKFSLLNSQDGPEQVHLALGNSTSVISVIWVTKYQDNGPIAEIWPCNQNSSAVNITGSTYTYNAGVFGWNGWLHESKFQSLNPASCYSYRIGSTDSGKAWSEIFSFQTPPPVGSNAPGTPFTSYAVYGDMGTIPLGFDVTKQMIGDYPLQPNGKFDLFVHAGDLAYAGTSGDDNREFEELWDLWFKQIQPLAAVTPYMTAVGNHEKYFNFTSYLARIDMPFQSGAQRNFYYSFDYGFAHFCCICTETYQYDYAPGTPQYAWIEQDLAAANNNRANVPFVFVVGHRPMYSSDQQTDSGDLQVDLEPLLYQYGVDVAIWGHMHEYERTYPVWNNTVTQYPVNGPDGLPLFVSPPSTIHLTIGTAGALIDERWIQPEPVWSAFRAEKYGYGNVRIYNSTTLFYGFHSLREASQIDGFWLQK